jgi:hypothetical protein
MGLSSVSVIVIPELVGEKFTGYNIADNQTASIAEWDYSELASIVKELEASDFDIPVLGFDGSELDEIMASLDCDGTSGQTDPDEVPEPPGSDWTETEPLGNRAKIKSHQRREFVSPQQKSQHRDTSLLTMIANQHPLAFRPEP